MQSVADIALRALNKRASTSRAPEPVRRQSGRRGRCEGVFWKRTTREDLKKIQLAARRFELTNKKAGARSGPLGHVALEILDLFANLIDFKTGRLEPSLQFIMAKTRRSKDAVVRALKALRTYGFLDWLRRYEPTNAESGPQVKQTSNAYRLIMPNRARALIERFFKPAPMPEDKAQELQERAAMYDAHRNSLATDQRILFDFEDDKLSQSLARLARAMARKKGEVA